MPEGTSVRSQPTSSTQPNHNPKPFEDRLLLLSIDEVYSQAARCALYQFPDAFASLRDAVKLAGHFRSHGSRVARFAVKLGRHLGLQARDQDLLYVTAMVHDVGTVLVKSQNDDRPRTFVNEPIDHVAIGRQIIVESFFCTPALTETIADAVLHHHECWDGSGYPFGLAGEKIPLLSRIIAIASEFDACVSRTDLLPAQALELAADSIIRQRGLAFDPACVDVFVRHRAFLTLGFSRRLSD